MKRIHIQLEPEKIEEPKIHRKKINKFLQVKYTDERMKEIYTSVARKNGEKALTELNKKSAASQFKSEIDKLEANISDLCDKILLGEETLNVECEAVYYYEDDRKTVTRLDTEEVIFDDKIPEHERQTELYDKDETEVDDKEVETLPLISESEEIPIVDIDNQITTSEDKNP